MDWLDQYLSELERPLPTAYLPPDKPTWNRPNPTKQQLSFLQDSIVMDLQRTRMIQEARQAEEQQGMGGSYGSVDAGSSPTGREGPVTPPTPPGPSPFALTYLTEELVYNGESITYGA